MWHVPKTPAASRRASERERLDHRAPTSNHRLNLCVLPFFSCLFFLHINQPRDVGRPLIKSWRPSSCDNHKDENQLCFFHSSHSNYAGSFFFFICRFVFSASTSFPQLEAMSLLHYRFPSSWLDEHAAMDQSEEEMTEGGGLNMLTSASILKCFLPPCSRPRPPLHHHKPCAGCSLVLCFASHCSVQLQTSHEPAVCPINGAAI